MNLQNLIDAGHLEDIDIFAGVSVPAPLDAETVKSAIMVRSGLMTPLYKEPKVFQALVTHWFIAKQWTIQHLINIIEAEYNPIENYNRIEDSSDTLSGEDVLTMAGGNQETHSGTDTETHSGTDTETHSGTDTETHSGTDTESHSGTDTTTNSISAENSSGWSNDTKSELANGESISNLHGHQISDLHGHQISDLHGHQISDLHGHVITDQYQNRSDTTEYGKINTRESTIHGNIGVTTNQQMIEQELELLRHFDIYGYIAELFENDNMLLIY